MPGTSPERDKYLQVLKAMYGAQKGSFFPQEAMPRVMEQVGLSEEEAVECAKYLMQQGYIKKPAQRVEFFFRPGYIQCFPVVLTAAGIALLQEKSS